MRAERATSDLYGSGSMNDSMSSRQCWISGTSQRTSFTGFGLMTGMCIFFGNKHRRPMGAGTSFHSARQEVGADNEAVTVAVGRNTFIQRGQSPWGEGRRSEYEHGLSTVTVCLLCFVGPQAPNKSPSPMVSPIKR